MASEQVVEIEGLLQPIAGEHPHGEDPRSDRSADSLYSKIKDARNSARAAERASLFDPAESGNILAAWRPVLTLSPELLDSQAKDLEVAAWYLEALLRHHHFAGLRDGLALIDGLVERFWDGLYPEPDEDGLETRVAPLTGLNGDGGEGTLLAPLRNLAITAPGSYSGSSFDCFSYWHYQQALETEKLSDKAAQEERVGRLGFDMGAVRQAVTVSPENFYVDLLDDLEAAIASFRHLQENLGRLCGGMAPPGSNILGTLEEIQRAARFVSKDKITADATPAPAGEAESASAAGPAPATVAPGAASIPVGPIASREDAFRQLLDIARFFRATEPHTPLAGGIERLVRWGNMSLGELISELVPDASAQALYSQLTGVAIGVDTGGTPSAPQPAREAAPVIRNTNTADTASKPLDDDGW